MPEDGEGWGLGRARCLRPLSGFGVADGGPQAADWRRHGFLMCVSDLLATGQPSEVKRVQPWGLADRVKGYANVPRTVSLSTLFFSNITFLTLLGCIICLISAHMLFMDITNRLTLIPPPVLPAQAPINIITRINIFDRFGQTLKSMVANPLVDKIVATWNTECLRVSPKSAQTRFLVRSKVISATDTKTIPANQRSSSLRSVQEN